MYTRECCSYWWWWWWPQIWALRRKQYGFNLWLVHHDMSRLQFCKWPKWWSMLCDLPFSVQVSPKGSCSRNWTLWREPCNCCRSVSLMWVDRHWLHTHKHIVSFWDLENPGSSRVMTYRMLSADIEQLNQRLCFLKKIVDVFYGHWSYNVNRW